MKPLHLIVILLFLTTSARSSGFGSEIGSFDYMYSDAKMVRFNFISFHMDWIDFPVLTTAVTMTEGKDYISFNSLYIAPLVIFISRMPPTKTFGYEYVVLALASPHILGNFKLHLPLFSDKYSLMIGESTDYYFRKGVFTESKVGIHLHFDRFIIETTYNKPWLKGAQDNIDPYVGVHLGIFFNMSLHQ